MAFDIQSVYGVQDGKFIRKDTQDATALIESNKAERNSGVNDQKGTNGRKFASVPMVVLEDLKQRLGIDWTLFGQDPDHTGRLLAWMQDPANQAWRTSEAKLGNANRFVQ